MHEAIKIISILPLVALFLDYAVAMQKVAPAGTRRALNAYSRQAIVATYPALKSNRTLTIKWNAGV